ncbi:MAG: 23S rRNA (uracil(1939)-C(5))-methyltransferase RlmD [Bacteroidales bacterium]|jgi:23S rRNA (uracil1939-C5)-methyltransferase|nr:23S rRNA (uracil(1939)-C(5))-methyltransferase RlmD [Bacteroidales bacterium]
MSKKNKTQLIIENVPIHDIADDGKAVGKIDDLVVFVSHAVPGDNVNVRVHKKRKKYVEGVVVHINNYSEFRVEPRCADFNTCGGCKWQDFDYEKQLHYKHKNVSDCLIRIGKLDVPGINPVLAADPNFFYRNKLEFTFSSNRWLTAQEIESDSEIINRNALGFHIPGMFDKVLDIEQCYLQPDPSNAIRLAIRNFALQEGMSFFDLRNHEGFLRTLVIRTSSTGEVMVIINFHYEDIEQREKLLDYVWKHFPEVTSLMYVINPKPHDSFADLEVQLYKGKPFIMEEMDHLKFKVGPKSFYQTNSKQAYELYKIVRDLAQLTGKETVYDLYTGTGTIANFIAAHARKVIGVEYVEEAIEDAKYNSALNGIQNTFFFAGDMKDIFTTEFVQKHGVPDVLILDPPRAGIHGKVIESLMFAMPKRIIYVSCNPSSQARDLALIQEYYNIKTVQPVDMFPHTHHVENVVMLERKI